jgi:hypothetical protein
MANLDLIKQRLNKFQTKGGSYEKTDYSKIFWKPKLGSQTVRILPNKLNSEDPFIQVDFHQYNVFKKSIYSLKNFGEKDPVVELVRELYNDGTDESRDLAKKIQPKTEYYAHVVVREEPEAGVRLWKFNKTTYEKILSIMANEDYGDIEDINTGTDLTVEGYNDSVKIGKREVSYIAVNITPKRNSTPLSKQSKQIEEWLESQVDIFSLYKKYSFAEIKDMFNQWMNPEGEQNDTSEDDEVVDVPEKKEAPKYSKSAPSYSKEVKPFAFEDEDGEEDEEEEEELPVKVQRPVVDINKVKNPKKANIKSKFDDMFEGDDN